MLRQRRRQLLFVTVGATCFLTQYAVLSALSRAGVSQPLANAGGFVISAQLNFALSARFTWRDRPAGAARTRLAQLLSYNVTALLSLAVNTAVFTLAYHRLGNLASAALGVVCGMCVTYLVCDLLIFRDRTRRVATAQATAGLANGRDARSGQRPLEPGVTNGAGDLLADPLEAVTLQALALQALALQADPQDTIPMEAVVLEADPQPAVALEADRRPAALLEADPLEAALLEAGPLDAAVLEAGPLDAGALDAAPPDDLIGAPGVPVTAEAAADGVTIVMPAYCEQDNLATTVADFLNVPATMGVPHCVVVVNDGSKDWTGEVADDLAAYNPGRVIAVHHWKNRGYGAAVSTGIATALKQTGHRWLFLTDSDGQFRAAQLPSFLDAARTERADVVVGYRIRRADPLYRRINAYLWTAASRLLLPIGIRDVDCSYKLIDRRTLHGVELKGAAATVSPELIATLRVRDARIIERPVDHFPREFGEQTGAKPSVIIRSLIGLIWLSLKIAAQRSPGRALRRLLHPQDAALAITTVAAVAASIASYTYFVRRHVTLAYPDAISHLLIARRVVDSPTPGVAQLGAVWLPLPHLLASPLIWVNPWYYSGFAGSVISMASYVLTVRYAYLITKGITGRRAGGLTAAAAFGANPNILYLQSTPMTEMLLIACIAASVYYLLRWCQTGRYIHLAATGTAALLASLTRYEGWVLCITVALVVGYAAWRLPSHDPGDPARPPSSRRGLARWRWWSRLQSAEANVIFYATVGMSGIVGWVLWNAVIFHDPLYFQTGPFAKPSLWVSHSDKAIGHLGIAALTYLYAMADNAGAVALAFGAAGLVWYLARTRLRPETIAPFCLLSFIPFYVYALYSGQRPLHVTQLNGSLYNVRFGLLMVLPTAIFIGYLVTLIPARAPAWARVPGYTAALVIALACAALVLHGGIATLTEAIVFRATSAERANAVTANWFRTHYTGGKVLMESFGNETVTFGSHVPLGVVVYEGSFRQWAPDLADPAAHGIRWIYMRRTPGSTDEVFQRLYGSVQLGRYRLVYSDPDCHIYKLAPNTRRSGLPSRSGNRSQPAPRRSAASPPRSRGARHLRSRRRDRLGHRAQNHHAREAPAVHVHQPGRPPQPRYHTQSSFVSRLPSRP